MCVRVRICVFAGLFQADIILKFYICLCRSVRPRLTVYVCQESPVVERQGSSENGENSVSPGLHGKNALRKLWSCARVLFTTAFHFCTVYHALYLEELTAAELIRKIAFVCGLPLGTINQVYRQGPTGILILLSDQVNMHNHKLNLAKILIEVPIL